MGSSSMSSLQPVARAAPSTTFLVVNRSRFVAVASATPESSRNARISSTRAPPPAPNRPPTRTLSRRVREWNRVGVWKVRTRPRWQIWWGPSPTMSRPRNRIRPAVGR